MALALDLRQVQSVEYGGDEIDNVVNESVQALQDTAKLLDRTLLEAATLALHQAQSVQIYGVAASAILGSIYVQTPASGNPHNCSAICIVLP